ncbi:MAG TPA: hypothetical protein VNA04_02490, partial [Thermoanaerobaculia bacterium]|nr:hypothetical protein [Thermoanaerobaculia bacterium]
PARESSRGLRAEARSVYVATVVRMSTSQDEGGNTFRQALDHHFVSRWWYHPVSFRDSESSPIYAWIVATLTIQKQAEAAGMKRIVIVGGPPAVSRALSAAFDVTVLDPAETQSPAMILLRGLASRVRYLLGSRRRIEAVKRHSLRPRRRADVLLAGFLDWSFRRDSEGGWTDRYFKALPAELEDRGVKTGWLAWLDPDAEPGMEGRPFPTILSQTGADDRVLMLQSFLNRRDVWRAIVDLRPLLAYWRWNRKGSFRRAFRHGSADLQPLFANDLLMGFSGASIPNCELVALATERAARAAQPRLLLTFLEHYPHSRAQYAGMRRAGAARLASMQHASYSRDKTFLHLDPQSELAGKPDGAVCPHPDVVFAMGTFGKQLFEECGYPPASVLLTGSARYEGLVVSRPAEVREEPPFRLLMVSSLDIHSEIEMVEAVVKAAGKAGGYGLRIRNHPFRRIETHPRFARIAGSVTISDSSLHDDIDGSDLILFTYSTVAEEALLRGKPVWQWLPSGFNGSALAEVVAIPQFGTIDALSEALAAYLRDPRPWLPDAERQQEVLLRLFYRAEGSASRIADELKARVAGAKPARPVDETAVPLRAGES